MAICIYHGDDNFQSRRELTNALKKYPQVKHFEGKDISSEGIIQASGGLFSQGNIAIVLEKLFSLSKKQFEEVNKYVEKLSSDYDFYVWEGKRLYPRQIKKIANKPKVNEYKLPNTIFKLLDSIGKSNHNQLLTFLQGSFETHPSEVIFYLVQKRLRKMILAKENSEHLTGAGWQKRNLFNQVKGISTDLIADWYRKTVMIEYKNKTGQLGRDLDKELVNLMVLFSRN